MYTETCHFLLLHAISQEMLHLLCLSFLWIVCQALPNLKKVRNKPVVSRKLESKLPCHNTLQERATFFQKQRTLDERVSNYSVSKDPVERTKVPVGPTLCLRVRSARAVRQFDYSYSNLLRSYLCIRQDSDLKSQRALMFGQDRYTSIIRWGIVALTPDPRELKYFRKYFSSIAGRSYESIQVNHCSKLSFVVNIPKCRLTEDHCQCCVQSAVEFPPKNSTALRALGYRGLPKRWVSSRSHSDFSLWHNKTRNRRLFLLSACSVQPEFQPMLWCPSSQRCASGYGAKVPNGLPHGIVHQLKFRTIRYGRPLGALLKDALILRPVLSKERAGAFGPTANLLSGVFEFPNLSELKHLRESFVNNPWVVYNKSTGCNKIEVRQGRSHRSSNSHRRSDFSRIARQWDCSGFSIFFLILTSCFFGTISNYVCSELSIYNILTNSTADVPLFYKISATWSNHEGSLLLWCWLLSFNGFLFSLSICNKKFSGNKSTSSARRSHDKASFQRIFVVINQSAVTYAIRQMYKSAVRLTMPMKTDGSLLQYPSRSSPNQRYEVHTRAVGVPSPT